MISPLLNKLHGLRQRHTLKRYVLIVVRRDHAFRKVGRKKDVDELGAVPRRDEEAGETVEPRSAVSGFLLQFALGSLLGALPRVDAAGWNLQKHLFSRKPKLPHEDHIAFAVQRHDPYDVIMLDDFTQSGAAVRKLDCVLTKTDDPPFVYAPARDYALRAGWHRLRSHFAEAMPLRSNSSG